MTKNQLQQEIARLNQDLTELTNMYDKLKEQNDTYKSTTAYLQDKISMLETGTMLDKEQILILEAEVANSRIFLYIANQRSDELQKTIDSISFSM